MNSTIDSADGKRRDAAPSTVFLSVKDGEETLNPLTRRTVEDILVLLASEEAVEAEKIRATVGSRSQEDGVFAVIKALGYNVEIRADPPAAGDTFQKRIRRALVALCGGNDPV